MEEHNPLHNRTLHISGTFKEAKKTDIEKEKVDIGEEKPPFHITDRITNLVAAISEQN